MVHMNQENFFKQIWVRSVDTHLSLKTVTNPGVHQKYYMKAPSGTFLEHFDLTKMLQDITPQSNISRWANRKWSPQIGGKHSAHDIILTE